LISEAVERDKAVKAKAKASPQREDFEREFGKNRVKTEADGSWSLSLHERSDIRKAHEMQEGSRRIEVEQGHIEQARMKRERLVRKGDGRVIEYPEELVDKNKDKFRPAGRNGNAPAERFGLSDAFRKYERGPDGLWFHWDDGWTPTNLWRNGALSPQRDPDANVWVEADGEWTLMDEVG